MYFALSSYIWGGFFFALVDAFFGTGTGPLYLSIAGVLSADNGDQFFSSFRGREEKFQKITIVSKKYHKIPNFAGTHCSWEWQ